MKCVLRTVVAIALGILLFANNAAAQSDRFFSKTETIQGTITTVQVDHQLLIVKSADGTFFDFQVPAATKIEIGGEKATLETLANQIGKTVAVTFRTLRTGDAALKITVQ